MIWGVRVGAARETEDGRALVIVGSPIVRRRGWKVVVRVALFLISTLANEDQAIILLAWPVVDGR